MKTVVAYLKGVPPNNTKSEKELVLKYFIEGVIRSGDKGILSNDYNLIDSDVGIIQGYVNETIPLSQHLKLRKLVVDTQQRKNKRTIIIDSNLFLYKDIANINTYLRFSYDGVFPNTGEYCNHNSSSEQWQKIKRDLNIELKPWRINSGEYILLCLQRSHGWSMKGTNLVSWASDVIGKIKKITDIPIKVRVHPGDKRSYTYINSITQLGVTVSYSPSLTKDLEKAYATIVHNSSPAVASVIEGVPTFATDPTACQANGVIHTDLNDLINLKLFDRTQWIHNMAQCHWNFEDLKSGRAWQHMRQWVTC